MAIISLFARKAVPTQLIRTLNGQNPSPILLDATLKEVFTIKAEATKHPVEKTADITDHVVVKPNGLTISGIITETPFQGLAGILKSSGASAASAAGAALGKFGPAAGALGAAAGALAAGSIASSLFGGSDRVLSAIAAEFVLLRDAKTPIDIQTGLRLYRQYIMEGCTLTRDQKSGGSIQVDLEFTEIIFATSEITTVAIPKVKGGLSKSNKGRQSKEGLSGDQTAQGSSLLKKLFSSGGA